VASKELSLFDDPTLPRGLGSTPFDGEGLSTSRQPLIDAGVLSTFLYDSYTARKAGVEPTANGQRGWAGPPGIGVFNLCVAKGQRSPEDIIGSCDRGLLLTRGLGRGVNAVSGEYSRGANGLWIEGGEIVHPVQEVTIAGDCREMLQSISAIGSDFTMRGTTGAPTIRIDGMTIGGL